MIKDMDNNNDKNNHDSNATRSRDLQKKFICSNIKTPMLCSEGVELGER